VNWSPFLRAVRLVGLGLLVLGAVGVAIGAASTVTYSCEQTYGVSAEAVADSETEATALENLSEPKRDLAREAIREGNAEAPNASVAGSLARKTVRYENQTYRFIQYHDDCTGNFLVGFLYLGGAAALVGTALGGGSHLALR